MLPTLVLAASMMCQAPPSGGILQTPPPQLVFFPGYTAQQKAVIRDYGMPTLGPRAGRVDNPYPFRIVYPGPDAPAGFYLISAARPWYFVPPSAYGIR